MFWKKNQGRVEAKWQWSLAGVFVVTMILNGLAGSTTLLGGKNTAGISDMYANLFTPAGVTFAIWGVIYLLVLGFIAYVFGFGRDKKSVLKTEVLTDITKLLTVNLALNAVWILAWQYQVIWLSVLLIVALLVTLAMIVEKLRGLELVGKEYVLARLPFSVYFGWISIATVANIAVWLVSIKWDGAGVTEGAWMVAILLVAAVIGLVTTLRNHDPAYLVVFVWAYAGILLRHLSPNGYDGAYPSTIITLSVLLAVFISVIVPYAKARIK